MGAAKGLGAPPAATLRRCAALAVLAAGWALLLMPAAARAQAPTVLVASVEGAITPVVDQYLTEALAKASEEGHTALLVRMDTPGGLDSSMRRIVQGILSSEVPVIVYVHPRGARAASAGAIIAFAAHVAAMAPGTAIGASTPVELEGGDVERKVINDAAAYAESIAELRGRDVGFAVDTVRKGRSASADEAQELGAVDLIAPSTPGLLEEIDGRRVEIGDDGREVTLRTAGAEQVPFDPGLFRRIQQALADPNIAFLFMSLGTLLIIYEVANPGLGLGGALGAILLVLALFSLSVLPINAVGLVLLGLAALLFVAEVFAPGVGVAAAGGTIALVLSGLFLVRDVPGLGVSLAVIAPVAVVVGGAIFIAGRLTVRAQLRKPSVGPASFEGREVEVRNADGRRGQAFVEGAWWNVRSEQGISGGDRVRVVGSDGLELIVEPVAGDSPSGAPAEESDPSRGK